jgi:hypothetical protein
MENIHDGIVDINIVNILNSLGQLLNVWKSYR